VVFAISDAGCSQSDGLLWAKITFPVLAAVIIAAIIVTLILMRTSLRNVGSRGFRKSAEKVSRLQEA
jgi:hypothetical protein